VDNPPTAQLTAPLASATLSGTATFTGTAADDIGVARVEFWCDGSVLLGSDTTAPYSLAYNTATISDGSHSFYCKAYDTAGHSANSAAITATVNNGVIAPPGGAYIWSQRFGGTVYNWDDATPVAIREDRNGDVIVVGSFRHTVDFGGGNLTSVPSAINGADLFIAKYSGSTGAHIWSKRMGSDGQDMANGVALDSNNNIVVVGTFMGTVDFGAGPMTSAGSSDIFVAKFAPSGALLWAKRFGGTAGESCLAVALDAANNIVLTGGYGYFGTAVDFGGGPLPLGGGQTAFQYDMYVAKLSSSGTHVWSRGFGGLGAEQGNAIAVDGNGDVAVVGDFQQTVSFGGGALASAGGYDVFVAKYSGATGSHLWSRSGGGTGEDACKGVAFDPSGNIVVTGEFNNSNANFGGANLVSSNDVTGMFLAKYSPTGTHLWSRGFSATAGSVIGAYASGQGVAVDNTGKIVVTGMVYGYVDVGGVLLVTGSGNILLAKFSADGNISWAKAYGGQTSDNGAGLTIGAANNILATGCFSYSVDFGGGLMQSPGGLDGFVVKLTP